jgi:hypothetical protein
LGGAITGGFNNTMQGESFGRGAWQGAVGGLIGGAILGGASAYIFNYTGWGQNAAQWFSNHSKGAYLNPSNPNSPFFRGNTSRPQIQRPEVNTRKNIPGRKPTAKSNLNSPDGDVDTGPLTFGDDETGSLFPYDEIIFGTGPEQNIHAMRHAVEELHLDPVAVQQAIVNDLNTNAFSRLAPTTTIRSTVVVDGIKLEYSVYLFSNRIVNVGRITTAP